MPLNLPREPDATELAHLVRIKEATPAELLEDFYSRVAEENEQLKAMVDVEYDQAKLLAEARPDAPFSGVPFVMKDLGANAAGFKRTVGSNYFSRILPRTQSDSLMTSRFREAGFVVAGVTAVPEFGLSLTTEPTLSGVVANPLDPSRTAGGSSGGAAAAVAGGLVSVAHATDGGGSIRYPAACCGLIGLKPTRGAFPQGPDFPNLFLGMASEHVLTKSVRDSEAIFDLMSRPGFYGPFPPIRRLSQDVHPLRIGILKREAPSTSEDMAVTEAERILAIAGLSWRVVDPATWTPFLEKSSSAFGIAAGVACAAAVDFGEKFSGTPPEEDELEVLTWAFVEYGKSLTVVDLYNANITAAATSEFIGRQFDEIDVIITCSTGEEVPLHGSLPMNHGNVFGHLARMEALAPFMAVLNVSGHPGLSIPISAGSDGLPISIQLVGQFGSESLLFSLAKTLRDAAGLGRR